MILPIQRFSFFKNVTKKNPRKLQAKLAQVIPCVATPLVVYMANTKTDAYNRAQKILDEVDKAKKPVTDRTKMNTHALEQAGYSNSDIKRLINGKGEIKDDAVKKELKSKNISFKGEENSLEQEIDNSSTENVNINIHDLANDSSLLSNMSASEISEIDVSMTPELENFTSIPFGENAGEFIDNITDVVAGNLDSDGGIFEMLKKSFLDISDWLEG